jgi:hypothetical protein
MTITITIAIAIQMTFFDDEDGMLERTTGLD